MNRNRNIRPILYVLHLLLFHLSRGVVSCFRSSLTPLIYLAVGQLISLELLAKTPVEIYQDASKSVVVIKNFDDKGKHLCSGSGIVINSGGDVVTNYHVIEHANNIVVISQNREFAAKIKHIDRIRDVCYLTVPGLHAAPVQVGSSSKVKIGSRVYAIGYPMNSGLTFSDGIVSSFREASGGNYIQFTAPISAGSSGGGLFDEQGRLIGIPTYFIAQGQLLNFALPVEWVLELPKRHDVTKESSTAMSSCDDAFRCKAIELEEKEEWVALTELAQRWTNTCAESALGWAMLGTAYINNGMVQAALGSFQKAVRFNADSMQYWLQLGLIYGKILQHDKEIEAYRMVVRINPDYSRVWYKLTTLYRDAGQFAQTLQACQQLVRINPANEFAWIQMGYAYGKMGKSEEQINSYREAIKVNQYSEDAYVCLGIAYGSSKRDLAEAEAYHQALIIHPDEVAALFNLGHYYLRHGQRQMGSTFYERLKVLNSVMASKFFDDPDLRFYPETVTQL